MSIFVGLKMKKLKSFLLTVITILFSISYEIGLGASVDTESPSLEITNPPSDAIIREEFAISGTWHDDGSISGINVEFVRLDNKNKTVFEGSCSTNGEEDKENGTWSIPINPVDSGLLDGTYEALVAITDNGGHKTTMARTFTIDNTPPVIILQKPSTTIADAAERFDTFGQIFSIVGQAADDNSVEKIDVSVYSSPDCSDSSFIKTVTLGSVPPTIDLNVAVFEENVNNDYSAIYGHNTKGNGAVPRYFKLEAYDNAKKYLADGSVDDTGNVQTSYYLYKDISDLITEYKATGLYKIQSGTYSGNAARTISVDTAKTQLNSKYNEIGKFKLNPDNSPTFVVSARSPLAANSVLTEAAYQLTSGNNYIEIQVNPGLDSNPIDEDSVGLYLYKCDEYGVTYPITPENQPICLFAPKTVANPYAHDSSKVVISVSGDSYKFKTANVISSLSYPGLEVGANYRIVVVGNDKNGAEKGSDIVEDSNSIYGFNLVSSGNFIELITKVEPDYVTSNPPENETAKGTEKNSLKITLQYRGSASYYVIYEDGQIVKDENNQPIIITSEPCSNVVKGNTSTTVTTKDITTTITKDRIAIGAYKSSGKDSITYKIKGVNDYNNDISIFNQTDVAASSEKSVTFIIDDESPQIEDTSIKVGTESYVSSKYHDNLYLNISGEFTEAHPDTVYYYVKTPDSTVAIPGCLKQLTGHSEISRFENNKFELKGVEFADNTSNGANTLYVQFMDKAGNLSAVKQYTFNIDTSAPELKAYWSRIGSGAFNNAAETIYVREGADLYIYGKYSDAQSGVKAITLPEGFPAGAEVKYSVTELSATDSSGIEAITNWENYDSDKKNDIKSWRLKYTPEEGGAVSIGGESGAGKKLTVNAFTLVLDIKEPEININKFFGTANSVNTDVYLNTGNNKYYLNPTDKEFTIKGNVTDNYGLEKITLYKNSVADTNRIGSAINCDSAVKEFTFDSIDLSSWGSSSKAIILAIDKAGNTSQKELDILFDESAPVAKHKIDDTLKDLEFRIGNYANENGLPDVGGKYSNGTYSSAQTMQIRGNFADEADGSGIKQYYYKVFNNQEVTIDAGKADGETSEDKIYFTSLTALKNYVIANKTSTFQCLTDAITNLPVTEAKAVEYNIRKEADGYDYAADNEKVRTWGGTATGQQKTVNGVTYLQFRTNVSSNYKTSVNGFREGKNYLVIVAEDNAGNSSVDYAEIPAPTNENPDNVIVYPCYSLNVDITAPTIPAKQEGNVFTNVIKKLAANDPDPDVTVMISGTVSDKPTVANGSSGLKSITFTSDQNSESVKLVPGTGLTDASAADRTAADDSTLMNWTVDVRPLLARSGPAIISANVEDNAGHTVSLPVATIIVDRDAPVVNITSPAANANVGKTFTIAGTASDQSGAGLDLTKKMDFEYTKDATITSSTVWTNFADQNAADSWNYLADISDAIAPDNENTNFYFRVSATDKAGSGNKGYSEARRVTIDRVKPVYDNRDTVSSVGGKAHSLVSTSWFKDTTLNIIGKFNDDGSGVTTIKYKVGENGTVNSLPTTDGTYNTNVSGFVSGSNKLYLWALDAAGNEIAEANYVEYTVRVDSNPPVITYANLGTGPNGEDENYEFSRIYLTNGNTPVEFKFYITEPNAESGIAGASAITLKIGEHTVTSGTGADDSTISIAAPDDNGKRLVTVHIRKNDLTSVEGYQTMLATVTDNAGNTSTPQAVGIVNKDDDAPDLTFTSPDANTEVNRTITVTGKAVDANEVEEITLVAECGEGSSKVTKTYTKTSADESSKITYANGIWSVNINTTELDNTFSAEGKNVTLTLTAKDKAGNETTAANAVTRILKINQSSDRPIVTIGSGVDFNQKNGNEIWVKGSATIYGSVIDDDGIATGGFKIFRKAAGSADSTFIDASASYSGGSWNVTLPEDGSYVLKFEIKDKANTTFTSAAITDSSTDSEILLTPVLKDSDEANKLGNTKANGNTLVPVCLDTNPPLLTITGISTNGTTWYEDVNASEINLGGIYRTLYVKAEASDTSGLYGDTDISGISASFSGSMTKAGSAYSCTSTASNYTVTKTSATDKNEFIITITGFDTGKNAANATVPFSGTLTFTITAKDKAGLETPKNFSRTVDNSAPVIKINAPEATVTSTAVVTGSIEGETVNPTIYYTVKTSETQPAEDDSSWIHESHAALTYNVYFDGSESSTTTHAPLFKNYLWDLEITSEADVIAGTYNEFTTLYVWIKAKDNCGNISYKSAPVVVDPQGNRPAVTITYPDNNTTLGGTIRVMGTANDNIEAKFAWIQIDMGGNGAGWDTGDYAILNAVTKSDGSPYYTFGKISTNQTLDEAGITNPDSSNISDIAIMVPVSGGSWYQNINTANELIPSGTSNNVTISVYATDNDDGSSILKSNVARRTITVDKDAPFFVQSSLKLVRYNAAGSVTAEQAYKEGMSVKGVWWLEGQIKDESSGISTITDTEGAEGTGDQLALIDSATAELPSGDYQFRKVAETTPNGTIYNYNFKIKVGAESGVGGLEFNISAQENKTLGALSTNKSFIVRYDNQPPTLAAHNAAVFNINTTVKNSLGYYQLGSTAYERNSGDTGVERVAVYFTRTLDGVTYVYDPMYKRSVEASRLETGTALVKDAGDNLYWGSAFASSITSDTLTLSAAPASYVHAGGLAKIKGVVYRINSISGNSVVLSGEPGDATSATDVYFAVANVVDNTSQESKGTPNSAYNASTGFGYGYCNNYTYDDGDKIMENFHKDDSTSWTWELWVNSKNIPDGDIAIHYVAFDKAGNSAYDHVDNAVVENNKPRLVSVKIGLDVNQDGEISETASDGEVTYYYPEGMAAKPTAYSQGVETINISNITVKGLMRVVPEVVGGNGDLLYRWKTKKTTEWQSVATRLMQGNNDYDDANFLDTDDYVSNTGLTTHTGTINHDTSWLISNSQNNCTDFFINYEIADSTQGRTKFAEGASASNKLCINITNINLLVRDEEEPDVVIDSLYWNSLTDNSVYNQEGHIELPSDLPSENFNVGNTATSGEFDNDPKVSGKVKLTGKISDNKVLTEVYITLPGMSGISTSTKVAVYNKTEGKWKNAAGSADFTTVGSLATEGYEFTILQNTNSFDVDHGHSVDWSLIWDSSKIGNGAAADVNFQVLAYDDAINAGQTANLSDSKGYKMDVVPYITNIETALSKLKSNNPSVYARTALGHYTVASTETIKISGFNLTGGTVKISSPNGNTEIAYDPDGISVASAKSGKLSVIVHDIESLNNKNDNDGHGDYAGTTTNPTGDKTIYSNYYNRQPNGDNNNLLTDDVVVDIWEIDSEAVMPMRRKGGIAQVVMKINPVTGQLGFAFANSAAYFSMPGKTVEAARDSSTAAWKNYNVIAFSPLRDYSYTYWNAELEPFTSIGFAYDKYGYSYGVASGGDINSGSKEALDFFSFMTDRWGKALGDTTTNDGYGRHNSSKHDQNAVRIEINGLRENGAAVFEPQRIKSPSIVVAAHGNSNESADTNVYLAYYDVLTSQIRFRAGNIGTKLTGVNSNYYDTTKYYELTKLEKSNTTGLSFYFINDNPYWNLSDGNRVKIWKEDEGGNKVLLEDYEDKEFIIYNLNVSDKKFALLLSDSTTTTEPLPLYDSSTSTKLKDGTYYIQAVPEKSKGFFGNFVNTYGTEIRLTNASFANAASSEANLGKIAEGTTAGEYVSMAVIPKGSTGGQASDDVVVIVWYGDDMKLHYAYNTTPSTIRGNGSTAGWTSTTLFTGDLEQAGEYCQVAVDANGGIHIAGLDSTNSDVVYAYIAKYNEPDKVKTCVVDSGGIVGDNLTIDVALDDEGNAIPRISYYNSSTKRPKLAYLANASTPNPDGAKEDMFTGKWECSIVPTSSKIDLSDVGNKINVGVWKDENGIVKNSTVISKIQSVDHVNNYYSTSYGIKGGNGSANPVVGYIVKKDSTTNAIETAQMK